MRQNFRSQTDLALVLKYKNIGEADRLVTVLTQKYGRLVTIAKGSRRLKSSKRAFLEPGNLVKVQIVETRSLPILTQATLISDLTKLRTSLKKIRSLQQILEIIDKLFVEEEINQGLFKLIIQTRSLLLQKNSNSKIKSNLNFLIQELGFKEQNSTGSLLDFVAQITERPMRSFEYLKV